MIYKKNGKDEEEVSYWQSYSDMMAALLLMFVLILTFTMLQSKRTIEQEQAELEQKEVELSIHESLYAEQEILLEIQQQELAEKESLYAEQQIILESQQQELAEKESLYAGQQVLLEAQQQELAEKESLYAEQQELLLQQQNQIENLVGVRGALIAALSEGFAESDMQVEVNPQTGSITFDSDLLFEINDYKLTENSKLFLRNFFPRYFEILMNEKFKGYVAEIIIEGHTAPSYSWLASLELSQERAYQVSSYILSEENGIIQPERLDELRKIITANGKSYSDPVYRPDGSIDNIACRRVELKFRLKDEDMIKEMENILENKDIGN